MDLIRISLSNTPILLIMFRFTIIPLILIFGTLFLSIFAYVIIRKIKKGVAKTLELGKKLASEQQQKWSQKDQRKKLPELLQNGLDKFEEIVKIHISLPPEWFNSLNPIVLQAQSILDEITAEAVHELEGEIKTQGKKLNSIRPFFNHSLDALHQFVKKLKSDHTSMDAQEIDKARQNISVFKADLMNHQDTLKKSRKMDFDVLMDVIKARLRK